LAVSLITILRIWIRISYSWNSKQSSFLTIKHTNSKVRWFLLIHYTKLKLVLVLEVPWSDFSRNELTTFFNEKNEENVSQNKLLLRFNWKMKKSFSDLFFPNSSTIVYLRTGLYSGVNPTKTLISSFFLFLTAAMLS
jgi:hypothetical protein